MEQLTTWNEALQRVRESKAALARDLAEKARCRGADPILIEYLEARAAVASMEAEHGAGLLEEKWRVRVVMKFDPQGVPRHPAAALGSQARFPKAR